MGDRRTLQSLEEGERELIRDLLLSMSACITDAQVIAFMAMMERTPPDMKAAFEEMRQRHTDMLRKLDALIVLMDVVDDKETSD